MYAVSCMLQLVYLHSYEIMLSCWQVAVKERLTFTELQAKFELMLASDGDNAYIDFSINSEMQYYKAEQDEDKVASEKSHPLPPESIHSANSDFDIECGTILSSEKESFPSTLAFSAAFPCGSNSSFHINTALQDRQTCGEERYVDNPGEASPRVLRPRVLRGVDNVSTDKRGQISDVGILRSGDSVA